LAQLAQQTDLPTSSITKCNKTAVFHLYWASVVHKPYDTNHETMKNHFVNWWLQGWMLETMAPNLSHSVMRLGFILACMLSRNYRYSSA